MNKPNLNKHQLKYNDLKVYAFGLTALCLALTWGIEQLALEWMRSG